MDRLLGHGTRITFIYGEPGELQPVSIFGAYCGPQSTGDIPRPFFIQDFAPEKRKAYFSWAPLNNIQAIRVFYCKDIGLCKGLIFRYENGGMRAVGQCRLHIDNDMVVVQPSRLCFRPTLYSTSRRIRQCHGVRVELGADGTHEHVDDGWKCLYLGQGVLTFSFTEDSSYISLAEGLAPPHPEKH
jgi:hypothetical protein